MRIIITRPNSKSINGVNAGGISEYCEALYKLFCGDNDINILQPQDYPMYKFPFTKVKFYRFKYLKDTFIENKADIVHINSYHSPSVIQAFFAAKKARSKIVYTAHFHPFETVPHPIALKFFFYVLIRPLVKRWADVVMTLNDEDTAFFKSFHNNVVRIPHWSRFSTISLEKQTKDPKMILFVGRFDSNNKGFDTLYSIPEGKYDIHCVGRCLGEKQIVARRDMTMHYNISNEELQQLYSRASLLVVPSSYEAFSYVTLEALTFQTPVVISNKVRIGDYIKNYNGCTIYKYGDNDDFNNAIDKTIGQIVDCNVLDIFNSEKIKGLYRKLYTSVMNKE